MCVRVCNTLTGPLMMIHHEGCVESSSRMTYDTRGVFPPVGVARWRLHIILPKRILFEYYEGYV